METKLEISPEDIDWDLVVAKNVKVLGTMYRIELLEPKDDPHWQEHHSWGYCVSMDQRIVVYKPGRHVFPKGTRSEAYIQRVRKTLRHEIVHAFLNESGLNGSAAGTGSESWAKNEEMVDWFAIQGPKIIEAWNTAGAIDLKF